MLTILPLFLLSLLTPSYASFFHGPPQPAALPAFAYAAVAPPAPPTFVKYAAAQQLPHISYAAPVAPVAHIAPVAPVIKYTLGAPVTTTTTTYAGFAAPHAIPFAAHASPSPAAVAYAAPPVAHYAAAAPPFVTRFAAAAAYPYHLAAPQPAYGRVALHAATPQVAATSYAAPLPCDNATW